MRATGVALSRLQLILSPETLRYTYSAWIGCERGAGVMTITKLSSSQAKKRTSLKERVSEAEWKVRTDLAAAYQLAVVYGWTDMILTHFSARVPDAENQFLLNAYGLMFDEV